MEDHTLNIVEWCEAVLRCLPYATIVTDKRGHILFVNDTAEDLAGVTRVHSIGRPLGEVFRLANPEAKVPSARAIGQLRVPKFYRRTFLVRKNGSKTLINASIAPVIGDRGVQHGLVVLFRDVSKDVANERMLVDRQKIEAISNMARSVGLDFSSWLTTISGHASSIADNVIPGTRAHDEALRIVEAAGQAGGLAKRLLGIAKPGGTTGDVKLGNVPTSEIIRNAISLVEGSFTERKIVFKCKDIDDVPYVIADAGQLLDCMMNLFTNSAEAMPEGGTIHIDFSEKTEGNQEYVVLRIKDTGRGMTKEVMNQVFEPFFSTKQSESSVGLGLTVVNNSVRSWGGYVTLHSKVNDSTVVRLFIRKADVQPAAAKEPTHQAGGETVLLADDDGELLAEMADALRQAGYKILTAGGGQECLKLFKSKPDEIAIVVLDAIMPGINGKQVLREILATDPTASILITSGFSRDYVRGYMEKGSWAFIQKPFEQGQLITTIRRVIDQRSAAIKRAATA